MSGFEFTPAGIVPLGTYREAQADGGIAGATADVPVADVVQQPKALATPAFSSRIVLKADGSIRLTTNEPLKPRDVVKLARARLREVEREIRRLHKLETERDELKRLIAAADNRPLAVVRKMPTRSA